MAEEIAILLTVHSRRDKTLSCLYQCFLQGDALQSEGQYRMSVHMVDDGSTDGTSEAVRERFPLVDIIKGDGTLYWNQGMRLAWGEAAKTDPAFYLWINDDTVLRDGALATLMETSQFLRHRAIVVGTCEDKSGNLSYGGRTKSGKMVVPDPDIPEPCYTFNGNLVLVPRTVYKSLGNLEPRYHHTFGDYDYGVRAAAKDIIRVVAPGILAQCDRNPGVEKWRDASLPLKVRFRALESPTGRPSREQFFYDLRDRGLFWAVGHGVSVIFKMLFPRKASASGGKERTRIENE